MPCMHVAPEDTSTITDTAGTSWSGGVLGKNLPSSAPRIVLIDDDLVMATMLSDYLLGEGVEVSHAATGAAGLELACDAGTNLVLLDITLPDQDGFTVLSQIRNRSSVPVIMLTMQGAVTDRVKGLDTGADDYVPKPFAPIEVLARIRSLLRRSQHAGESDSRLVVDDITLVPTSRTVLKGGRAVRCTAAEFDALFLLAGCPGSVVTKEDLTRTALGRRSYAGDRGVDNLVHALRKKLGSRADGNDRCVAIRNIGYVYLHSAPLLNRESRD